MNRVRSDWHFQERTFESSEFWGSEVPLTAKSARPTPTSPRFALAGILFPAS